MIQNYAFEELETKSWNPQAGQKGLAACWVVSLWHGCVMRAVEVLIHLPPDLYCNSMAEAPPAATAGP